MSPLVQLSALGLLLISISNALEVCTKKSFFGNDQQLNCLSKCCGLTDLTRFCCMSSDDIGNAVVNAAKWIGNGVKNSADSISSGIKNAVDSISNGVKNSADSISSGIKNTVDSIRNGVVNTANSIGSSSKSGKKLNTDLTTTGLSTMAIVGIVVGSIAFIALVAGVITFVVCCNCSQRRPGRVAPVNQPQVTVVSTGHTYPGYPGLQQGGNGVIHQPLQGYPAPVYTQPCRPPESTHPSLMCNNGAPDPC